MIIKTKLTEKDFINVSFVMMYSKFAMKLFTGIMILTFFIKLLEAIFMPFGSFLQVPITLIMLSILLSILYFSAKKSYAADERIRESIEYHFENDTMTMKGDSFNSQMTWDKIHQVTQTKNWLLIWQNRQIANPIPKRDIDSDQLQELKKILTARTVKNNL